MSNVLMFLAFMAATIGVGAWISRRAITGYMDGGETHLNSVMESLDDAAERQAMIREAREYHPSRWGK